MPYAWSLCNCPSVESPRSTFRRLLWETTMALTALATSSEKLPQGWMAPAPFLFGPNSRPAFGDPATRLDFLLVTSGSRRPLDHAFAGHAHDDGVFSMVPVVIPILPRQPPMMAKKGCKPSRNDIDFVRQANALQVLTSKSANLAGIVEVTFSEVTARPPDFPCVLAKTPALGLRKGLHPCQDLTPRVAGRTLPERLERRSVPFVSIRLSETDHFVRTFVVKREAKGNEVFNFCFAIEQVRAADSLPEKGQQRPAGSSLSSFHRSNRSRFSLSGG